MSIATMPKKAVAGTSAAVADAVPNESVVDRDSHFDGLYETRQDLRIEGIAEGEIQCEGLLTVAEGARVKAKVTASTITIAGALEGDVVCQGVFQIMPSGQVQATVVAHRLVVQEGGFFDGDFHMITDENKLREASRAVPRRDAAPPPDRIAPAPASPKEKAVPERPANGPRPGKLLSSDEWWQKMSATPPPDETQPGPA